MIEVHPCVAGLSIIDSFLTNFMPFANMFCMRKHIETSDYYVAYFDVLGYKERFNNGKEVVQDFIDDLCSAIDDTIAVVNDMQSSKILKLAQIDFQQRIFSDNVLVCLKKGDTTLEPVRILTFLQTIIDIQRKFVLEHGILLRGGISVGQLYIDESRLVGEVLIKVVAMEHAVKYPFIAIDDTVMEVLTSLTAKYADNQSLQYFITWIKSVFIRFEGVAFKTLDYLNYITVQDIWPFIRGNEDQLINALSGQYNGDATQIQRHLNQDRDDAQCRVLNLHKEVLKKQIAVYCNYDDIDFHDEKKILEREKIIMKYKWVWVYHNTKCAQVNRKDLVLNLIVTYDERIMKDVFRIPAVTSVDAGK